MHRENVVWQSRDGTWGIGFFDYYNINQDSEDFDPEWDVEYVYDCFSWASTGHATEDDAHAAWRGANPGCSEVYKEPSVDTDKFDVMEKECRSR